jgi:hypothetical protein
MSATAVNQRIIAWESLLMQTGPTSEEAAFLWKQSKRHLEQHGLSVLPELVETEQLHSLSFEEINLFRIPFNGLTQDLFCYLSELFASPKIKYDTLRSGVYNSRPFKPPVRVIALASWIIDQNSGHKIFWIAIYVNPHQGLESDAHKMVGRRRIALFTRSPNSRKVILDKIWNITHPVFGNVTNESILTESGEYSEIVEASTSPAKASKQALSEIYCLHPKSGGKHSKTLAVEGPIFSGKKIQEKEIQISPVEISNNSNHSSSSGNDPPPPVNSHNNEELKEEPGTTRHQLQNRSNTIQRTNNLHLNDIFEFPESDRGRERETMTSLHPPNTLSTRRSFRFSQGSLASLNTTSIYSPAECKSIERELFPDFHQPHSQSNLFKFINLDLSIVERVCSSEKFFVAYSHNHERMTTVLSNNFKMYKTNSLCSLSDGNSNNRIYEWTRGVYMRG